MEYHWSEYLSDIKIPEQLRQNIAVTIQGKEWRKALAKAKKQKQKKHNEFIDDLQCNESNKRNIEQTTRTPAKTYAGKKSEANRSEVEL